MFEELENIRNKCINCEKCPLCKTRTNLVFSDGVPNSNMVLIGEAPGFYEDQEGRPFVGRSGKLLDQIFASVGMYRNKDFYICNTIKCRPPNNRKPLQSEKCACREFLDAQLDVLRPKIIILCGSTAVESFLDTDLGITKIRGKWFDGPYDSKMIPIFHPSYLLRNPSKDKFSPKWYMWQDVQDIKKEYEKLLC